MGMCAIRINIVKLACWGLLILCPGIIFRLATPLSEYTTGKRSVLPLVLDAHLPCSLALCLSFSKTAAHVYLIGVASYAIELCAAPSSSAL